MTLFFQTLLIFRRKTLYVPFSRMPMAFRSLRRVDPSLPQTHGSQAIQMQSLRALLCPLWSFGSSHEETLTKGTKATSVWILIIKCYSYNSTPFLMNTNSNSNQSQVNFKALLNFYFFWSILCFFLCAKYKHTQLLGENTTSKKIYSRGQ